jgi:protein-histidine pros-kinase
MTSHLERDRPAPDLGGLLDAAPDAMVVVDDRGVMVLVNAQAESLFGYARGELVGRPVEMLIPARLEGRHRAHRASYAAEPHVRGMGESIDLLARRKDGVEFPVEISLGPLQTNEGLLVSAAIRDVTRRRSDERLFRALVESAPDAMVIVDAEARIVLVNAQTERLFGFPRSELVGQHVELLVPERFARMHEGLRSGYLTAPHARPMGFVGDLYARRRDGSEFPVEISLAPLESDAGPLVSAAVRDITDRRLLEEREKLDRAKDEFFATVSHELRTPLTSVLGYSELLADLPLDGQAQRFVAVIAKNALRELRLVDDLLTLASLENGGLKIRGCVLDLGPVVRNAVVAAQPHADRQGVALTLKDLDAPVLVEADADRIGQAIDNLVSNALKFTPPGGSVAVHLFAGQDVAHVEVADTGSGIAEPETERIFERLFRAEAAVAGQVPGAGLGLTIALAIAVAHRGTIGIVKSDRTGATFRLQLPLSPAAG